MVIGLVGGAFTSQGRAAHKGVNGNIFRRPVEQQQPKTPVAIFIMETLSTYKARNVKSALQANWATSLRKFTQENKYKKYIFSL